MIPDTNTIEASLLSESAATAKEPRIIVIDAIQHPSSSNANIGRVNLNVANRYIHRIPSRSSQWENYLHELVAARAKRTRRMMYAQETINEFLQRFPIDESS